MRHEFAGLVSPNHFLSLHRVNVAKSQLHNDVLSLLFVGLGPVDLPKETSAKKRLEFVGNTDPLCIAPKLTASYMSEVTNLSYISEVIPT